MALSVKLAMLMSLGAVGVISWLVQTVDPPQVRRPHPFVVTDLRGRSGGTDAGPKLVLAARVDRRGELARQLERPNPLEVQVAENRTVGPALALLPPGEPYAQESTPLLPPLVYGDDAVVAGVEDMMPVVVDGARPTDSDGTVLLAATDPQTGSLPTTAAEWRRVRAGKGDTLSKIAAREWGKPDPRLVQLLAEVNPGLKARSNRVRVGEELVIPDQATAQRWLSGERPALPGAALASASGAGKFVGETDAARWYTIQKNDSLQRIAQQQLRDSNRWREILNLNRTLNPSRIQPGTRIRLPALLKVAQR